MSTLRSSIGYFGAKLRPNSPLRIARLAKANSLDPMGFRFHPPRAPVSPERRAVELLRPKPVSTLVLLHDSATPDDIAICRRFDAIEDKHFRKYAAEKSHDSVAAHEHRLKVLEAYYASIDINGCRLTK